MKAGRYVSCFFFIALFGLMPFVYSQRLQDVEQSPRFLFMGITLLISSLASAIIIFRNGVSVRKSHLFTLIGILLTVYIFSYMRSINTGDGFFELLKLLLYFACFFQVLVFLSWDNDNRLCIYRSIGIAAIVFVVVGAWQVYDAVSAAAGKGGIFKMDYSIASTLGNKNFFAETLLIMLPVLLLSIAEHRGAWKVFFMIAAGLVVMSVAILQTLSTWLALATAGVWVLVSIFIYRDKVFTSAKALKRFYYGVAVTIIAAGVVLTGFMQITGSAQISQRIRVFESMLHPERLDPDSVRQNSIYERITLWKQSVEMTRDYPVFGAGLGNWKILAPSYGMANATYMTTGAIRFVHPHNEFLLVVTETGILGLMVILVLFGWLMYAAFSVIRSENNSMNVWTGMAVMSGVVLYAMISMVSLPASRIYPQLILMIYMAILVANHGKSRGQTSFIHKKGLLISMVVIIAIAGASVVTGGKRLSAERNLSSALLNERRGNYTAMGSRLAGINKMVYPLDVTGTPIAWYQGFCAFYLGDQGKALELFREAEQVNPNHLRVLNDLGTCYNLKNDPQTAMMYYHRALEIQPGFGDALLNLAIVHFNAGRTDSAYAYIIRHRDKVKPESVAVFSTILLAEAGKQVSDSVALEQVAGRLKKAESIRLFLKEIRANPRGLNGVLQP